jgi:crotonobetaine/carnitine-CoA ligase
MAGESFYFLDDDDRYMIVLPLFHVGGTLAVYAMLARGGSIAAIEAFDTNSIWRLVRDTGTTVLVLLGVMPHFLTKLQPGPGDRDHPLKKVIMVPLQDAPAFAQRFGVDVYTVFNMTEISSPIISDRNPAIDGSCGKKRNGVDVRIVDENDLEVPTGTIGELIVRTDRPWGMNHGYYKNPEATARAWRNGWFHTAMHFGSIRTATTFLWIASRTLSADVAKTSPLSKSKQRYAAIRPLRKRRPWQYRARSVKTKYFLLYL